MDHIAKDGAPDLVDCCTFPLTGVRCVTRVFTSHAVIDIQGGEALSATRCQAFQWPSFRR